ncbi:putative UDP-glucose glucosyltransferase [Acorus calamus]|uniref:UDP-glucose glucosyltransferase n=1 Tax=Acorus calamus TaxID=4465 RepID=A0AAV9C6C8_ACOCL|nr:putative UDP-glucose glucosyltransferase [Acorus calamus]
MIRLGPEMPLMNTAHLWWNCLGDPSTERVAFNYTTRGNKSIDTSADWVLCNSFSHIESPVFKYALKDSSCEEWLDQQPPKSVVYVAFGSFNIFQPRQFKELALGLDMIGRQFLWVVRPDLIEKAKMAILEGFEERVVGRGRMVGWSPQQRVLAHPSVVCFMSH